MLNPKNLLSTRSFSPLFYFKDRCIRYHGIKAGRPAIDIHFNKMRDYQLFDGKPQSLIVRQLAYESLDCPSRVYHLAGFINYHFPEIDWDWETLLMNFERELRENKYGDAYFNKTGHNFQSSFYSDWEFYDWLFELNIYLKSCESDEQLKIRCKERMKKWFKGTY